MCNQKDDRAFIVKTDGRAFSLLISALPWSVCNVSLDTYQPAFSAKNSTSRNEFSDIPWFAHVADPIRLLSPDQQIPVSRVRREFADANHQRTVFLPQHVLECR
jgi:hypothetical protein